MDTDDLTGFLPRSSFKDLFTLLLREGFRIVGPREEDGTIVFKPVTSISDLPVGVRDDQSPGRYRISHQPTVRNFSWANGPQALKPLLFPPVETLWESRQDPDGRLSFLNAPDLSLPTAVIGLRSCDLVALDLQDRHFLNGPFPDRGYRSRREKLLLIGVHCSHPAATCFCASTGDGPGIRSGFDLVLGETDEGFVVSAGSEKGRNLRDQLPLRPALAKEIQIVREEIEAAARIQTRALPPGNLRDRLFLRLEAPHWDTVAQRCLSCGNCTMVCPTCFCSRNLEETDLPGNTSKTLRQWDSCFTSEHSYIHPAPVRGTTTFRYRQWLTHKLGSWHDQYGRSGCVGCGRCLTWCPTGIDMTQDLPHLFSWEPPGE